MSIAIIATFAAFIFFVRSFSRLIRFLIWRKHELFEGKLGPLIRVEEKNGDKKSFNTIYINTVRETVTTEFKQITRIAKSPLLKEGDVIEVYYNPRTNQCRSKKDLIEALWINPVMCLIGIGVVIICIVINS